MKMKIFSEEFRDGIEVDWPAVPREGELVSFAHRGGTSNLRVDHVRWYCTTEGFFEEVEVNLTFGES